MKQSGEDLMLKPEDLLEAYNSLCLCTLVKIETLFLTYRNKDVAMGFKANLEYFMRIDTPHEIPGTLDTQQAITDAFGNSVDLKEPQPFLRLSHLLLDYDKPINILPPCSPRLKSSSMYEAITALMDHLRCMGETYRRFQSDEKAEDHQKTFVGDSVEESPDLKLLGEFCKSYFWLGESLSPIREEYTKFLQSDTKRYKLLREKDVMRVELYKKFWTADNTDEEIFRAMNREEMKLLDEGKTTRQCSISSYRAWKSRAIKSGKLSKAYLKKPMFAYRPLLID